MPDIFESDPDDFIPNIKTVPMDKLMDLVYQKLVNNKEAALNAHVDPDKKKSAIQYIIDFYAMHENYERCFKLRNIQQEIC